MAGTVVIGCADQSLAYELRSQLSEAAEVEVVGVAETTTEMADLVLQHEPNLVLVHDQLGPEPVHQVIRDLGMRRPASAAIVVTSDGEPEALAAAMDAGARGVLSYPLSFADVQLRVNTALDWSRHMQSLLINAFADGGNARGRATVVAITGTKGGVGTTTLVTHLAWDVRRELPDHKVLVVDLDLEKGDVSSLIEARARTSVADLAKVAQDLSVRTVADAVFQHESGIHLLLPPDDVRDAELVTPTAIRQIVGLLRQQYDLVLIDVGAHVTPVQAAVVEIADEVVSVITPDLISIRALRRTLGWWETLQVRKPDSVHVLINKASRTDEVQPETAKRLSPGRMLTTVLPDMGRKLETAMNSRAPELVTDPTWWRSLRALGREVGLVRAPGSGEQSGPVETSSRRSSGRRQKSAANDSGSAAVELVALLPAIALVCAVLWQLGMTGLTYVWTGYGASAAARSVALGDSPSEVRTAAQDAFPAGMRSDVTVDVASPLPSSVDVSVRIPVMMPGILDTPWTAEVHREVVKEP
ncbi:AAA family ATPase [Cellulomonas humilata]|uniref:AAA family ATPase n=1 Tax=Cellulomonas humilata TaxID=144055 RepID=A0A7Y6A3C0_9CELL|nr:AAA family ATPase [Cellulomonas humilata]NUU18150.1 AAA family ATPase [Cellulomonas humilata]